MQGMLAVMLNAGKYSGKVPHVWVVGQVWSSGLQEHVAAE